MKLVHYKILPILLLFFTNFSFGQNPEYKAEQKYNTNFNNLKNQFTDYTIYQIDSKSLTNFVTSEKDDFTFNLKLNEELNFTITLFENDIRNEDYSIRVLTDDGEKSIKKGANIAFKGHNDKGNKVVLSIAENFISGFIENNGENYYLEPLSNFIKGNTDDLFVAYKESSVIHTENNTCYAIEVEKNNNVRLNENKASNGTCYTVDIAIASDYSNYVFYGNSYINVTNQHVAVMNAVQANFDDDFFVEIDFAITQHFVSTCSSCDPWTGGTNGNALLSSFRAWGENGGFTRNFDVGSLWTRRNFLFNGNPDIVGIAYIGGLCNSNKYNILENYTTSLKTLRTLTAHELGHNFGAVHSSGCIMNSIINGTSCWDPSSITAIDLKIEQSINNGCLTDCPVCSLPPPSALTTSNIASNTAQINWSAAPVSGNDGYQLEYQKILESGWNTINVSNITTSYVLNNLQDSTAYQWRIRTSCSTGRYSDWSTVANFTTPKCTEYLRLYTQSKDFYESSNQIASNAIINSGANVVYSAGKKIVLINTPLGGSIASFHAKAGSRFLAKIEGCSPNLNVKSNSKDNMVNAYVATEIYDYTSNEENTLVGKQTIKLYPNPTSGNITIESLKDIAYWELNNIYGQTLNKEFVSIEHPKKVELDLSILQTGVYFVKTTLEDGEIITNQIIKK